MRKVALITIFLTLCFLLSGCFFHADDDGHYEVLFVNKSGINISYQLAFDKISEIAMDTLFHCRKVVSYLDKDSKKVIESPSYKDPWEVSLGSNQYLEILVFDNETFREHSSSPCEVIRQNVPILRAYRLTLTDLEKANWVITYY